MRSSWIKILFACLLFAGLPIFIWAVATQRIELRKRAATSEPRQICWNRVITFNNAYNWPNSCKGNPSTAGQGCAQILVPLTSEEIHEYQRWVSAGSPYIPGCNMPTSTPIPIQRCTTNGASCTITTCPPMPPCPSGAFCTQGIPACTVQPGICQNNRCVPCTMPPPCAYATPPCTYAVQGVTYCPRPTPTPSCIPEPPCLQGIIDPITGDIVYCDPKPGTIFCTPTPTHYVTPTPTVIIPTKTGCIKSPAYTGDGCYSYRLITSLESSSACYTLTQCLPMQGNGTCVKSPTYIGDLCNGYRVMSGISRACYSYEQCQALLITPTPTSTPMPVNLKFNVRLAGVTGAEAKGATIQVKLKLKDGTVLPFDKPLVLDSVGNGVYEATATLTNPLPSGTAMRVLIKGEKHSQIVFCRQSGQTEPCNDTDYITPSPYSFDFTGRPLPPGDLNQDGKVNTADLKFITDLFNKPSSQQTPQDLKTADVNYSGKVDSLDLSLVFQTLETRYDEQ